MRQRRLWRACFFSFAGALFVGTHWPNFKMTVPGVERPDLLIHFVIFATWGGLLALTGLLGPPGRVRSFVQVMAVGITYAAVDESLQAIPALQRTAAFDDFAANCIGLAIGASLLTILARIFAPSYQPE